MITDSENDLMVVQGNNIIRKFSHVKSGTP